MTANDDTSAVPQAPDVREPDPDEPEAEAEQPDVDVQDPQDAQDPVPPGPEAEDDVHEDHVPKDDAPTDDAPTDDAPKDDVAEDDAPADPDAAVPPLEVPPVAPLVAPAPENDDAPGPETAPAPAVPASSSGWRRLGEALRPRLTRSQLLAGVLCAALGFALAVQVQQSASDQLASARQEDLVRLLDEVTQRADRLDDEVARLEATRDELASGTGQAQAALELARERAASEGILSGRLPAEGPGVEISISDPNRALTASQLFNVLEELRNAGAEAVQLNGVRLVTSSWFVDRDGVIVVDDHELSPPYRWTAIGDPATISPALEIPGGAFATVRNRGATVTLLSQDEVEVTAVREPSEPRFARPVEPSD